MNSESIEIHLKLRGKIEIKPRINLTRENFHLLYTPGVAEAAQMVHKEPQALYQLTNKWNSVAIVSDGSAVLGLGNIGPQAALPVMEGKALLFKELSGIDAVPLCIDTLDSDEIVQFVKNIAPTFGGINLEDISSPRCFYIERKLRQILQIPVFHDDQHGAAIAILAALKNALKIVDKRLSSVKIVVIGVGAAGGATIKMLLKMGASNIIACDKAGILNKNDDSTMLNSFHREICFETNPDNIKGELSDAVKGADVVIGTSVAGILNGEMIKKMERDPIVFALANPVPEIMPEEAKLAGARIVATGRSDFPNQINNALVFPGLFRGALNARSKTINFPMMSAAAEALSDSIPEEELSEDRIIPSVFDKGVVERVAKAVFRAAVDSGVGHIDP